MSYHSDFDNPLVIYLQYPIATCCICGVDCVSAWGVPIGADGEWCARIVSNDYEGEWGGKPACPDCWKRHENGEFVGEYPKY